VASHDNSKPNIVFILTDDQGAWAMGCAGNPEIRTPNLDRIAATGMRFANFFCTSPVCSPARASILTGRIPSQHGVHDWIRGGNVTSGQDHAIEYLEGMTGYTDVLAAHGYRCAMSGKWHMGHSVKPQKGFSHWYTHQFGGGPYYDAPMIRNGELIKEPGYVTDNITDEALKILDDYAAGDAPFYLSVHYTAPHSPWINSHPEDVVASYGDCAFESCPEKPLHEWSIHTAPRGTGQVRLDNLKGYFAAVTCMDANVGRLLDKLEALGLRQNTLVVFISDNGMNMGHHGIWGKGNGTFPQNMFDTSVKVPCLASHPSVIPEGVVCDALLSQYDFMPTLLDYCGLENPEAERLPGRSFASVLKGGSMAEHEAVYVYDEYGPVRMVRTREWKYVHRYPYGPHELYDLVNDPDERTDLVADESRQALKEELKAQLDEWYDTWADPRLDGTREAVYGKGQLQLAGPGGKGKKAYADDVK